MCRKWNYSLLQGDPLACVTQSSSNSSATNLKGQGNCHRAFCTCDNSSQKAPSQYFVGLITMQIAYSYTFSDFNLLNCVLLQALGTNAVSISAFRGRICLINVIILLQTLYVVRAHLDHPSAWWLKLSLCPCDIIKSFLRDTSFSHARKCCWKTDPWQPDIIHVLMESQKKDRG